MHTTVPQSDLDSGWGGHYHTSANGLKEGYRGDCAAAYDTWERHPDYKRAIDGLAGRVL